MEEDIKILEEYLNKNDRQFMSEKRYKFLNALENLIESYKQKDKDNNDLRRLYRRTAIKLRENGKEELADYFLAQINEVPTFTVDDDIDYYEEYYKQREEIKKLKSETETLLGQNEWYKDYYDCESIPKSKVEGKIEEIKNETWYIDCGVEAKQSCIEVLQELLEKRK